MSHATYFVQDCPTCGRRLQVRVSFLGKPIVCPHCCGRFDACDPDNSVAQPAASSSNALLQRVDELLASSEPLRNRPR